MFSAAASGSRVAAGPGSASGRVAFTVTHTSGQCGGRPPETKWCVWQKAAVAADRAHKHEAWVKRHKRTAGRMEGEEREVELLTGTFRESGIALFALLTEVANQEWQRCDIEACEDVEDMWDDVRKEVVRRVEEHVQSTAVEMTSPIGECDRQLFRTLRRMVMFTARAGQM